MAQFLLRRVVRVGLAQDESASQTHSMNDISHHIHMHMSREIPLAYLLSIVLFDLLSLDTVFNMWLI